MGENIGLTIEIPKDNLTFTGHMNILKILDAKRDLICKALGTENLEIETKEDRYLFPWFSTLPSPEEVKAYTNFVTLLCKSANNTKWVNSKKRATDNEKYAFRCFLLRLGFIGEEYKEDRKILLRNLSGSSAFRTGKEEPNEDRQGCDSEGETILS